MHLVRWSILPVTDNLSADFLLSREVLHSTRIQRITHLMQHRAVTVTFSVFRHATCDNTVLLILCDDLLSLDSVTLGTDMIGLDYTQLLFHLIPLLSDNVWSDQIVGTAWFDILKAILLTIRKFAILGHANWVLCQRGLEKEFTVFNAYRWSPIDALIFKTGLRSCNRVLRRWITYIGAKRSRWSISVARSINGWLLLIHILIYKWLL